MQLTLDRWRSGQRVGQSPVLIFDNRNFRLVFTAAAASKFGIQVSYIAIPLLAVLTLNATPGQVGLLGVLSTVAFLAIGLPAGAWVDRLDKRGVQVAADLLRAVLFGSVPLAWALHALTIEQLYLVVCLSGVATVFFDVAAQSFLPHVVGRDNLVAANTRLVSIDAVNIIAGRSVGGFLVQLLTAPLAVAFNGLTFLWSAMCLTRLPKLESRAASRPRTGLAREVNEGIRFVFGHPLLRPIALTGTLNNLSVQISTVMLPVLLARDLGFSPTSVGFFLSTGGIGVFAGTLIARRMGARLGYGRVMWLIGLATVPAKLFIPLLQHGLLVWLAAFGWLLTTVQVGVNNVLQVSLRQRATPDRLLGRMNATMRFLLFGSLTVGAAIAGMVGEVAGARAALSVGVVGLMLVWLPPFLSPLRTLRELPEQVSA
jgi:predicted MFS family arabinose efflux permease